MEIQDRIVSIIEAKGLNKKTFSEAVDIQPQTLHHIVGGRRTYPSYDVIRKILYTYSDISERWLLLGEGNMEKKIAPNIAPNSVLVHEQKVNYHTKVLPIQVDQDNNERIVYVPISARAGYKVGFSDPIYIEKLPSFNLPGHTHGTFRAFQVSGFSMYPTFNDNDIAIGQYVERVEHVYNNRVYLIVSKEDVLLKRVRLSISTKEIILLSDSEEFEPITVPFKEIKEIWCVTDKITKNMAPPSELEARVAKLEQKLSKIKR